MKGLKITDEGFKVTAGGFAIVDTDSQSVSSIVKCSPGHAIDPYLGVRLFDYINAPFSPTLLNGLKKKIKLNLLREGMTIKKVDLNDYPNLMIQAGYDS